MIFRKCRTLIIILIILGLGLVAFRMLPYLNKLPKLQGVAQGNGAGYPLRSLDRTLIDLNGTWQSYGSMGDAVDFAPSAVKQAAGVKAEVYGEAIPDPGVGVPGSFDSSVVVRQFQLGNDLSGRNFRLHFLGTGGQIEVFINGFSPAESVGEIDGGNVPVSVDIPAPRFRFGQANTIAVKLKKAQAARPWLTFPGLTSEVYLEALGSIELNNPLLSTRLKADGSVELSYTISVKVKGTSDKLTGQITLVDASGNVTATNGISIKNESQSVVTGKLAVSQPRLWSPEDPYLYRLQVFVSAESGERDSYFLLVGLKELKLKNGLELNGKNFEPRTLLRVNDSPAGAGSADAAALEADIKWAKAKGYNSLYLPDRPAHPYLLDLADRYGLLVFSQSSVGRLQAADQWQRSMDEAAQVQKVLGHHASLAAQGLGSELDTKNKAVQAYLQQTSGLGQVFYTVLGQPNKLVFSGNGQLAIAAPYLADFIAVKPSFSGSGFMQTQLQRAGILTRDRAEKGQEASVQGKAEIPPYIPLVPGVIALVLILRSWHVDNLRFSSLAGAKPNRKLRCRIRLQLFWYLLRVAVLALIPAQLAGWYGSGPLTDFFIESIPLHPLQVLAWYLLAHPWDLFIVLFCGGLFLSHLLNWPRARTLPGRPGTIAVTLWLEKRKRWSVLVLGAWILAFYAGYYWLVWAVLGMGYVLSRFAVSKDIRRAGGKTFELLWFACLLVLCLVVLIFNWNALTYIYHWAIV